MSDSLSLSSDDEDFSINGDEFNGQVLIDRYVLIKKIGYGAFSSVWLTYDRNNDNFYAIKIQNADDYDEGIMELEVLKEIKRNNFNHLITLIDDFTIITSKNNHTLKYICMVFELFAGSLYDIMKYSKYEDGLPINSVKLIIKQVLKGLRNLNKINIIHGDLKPENILLKGVKTNLQKFIDEYKKFNFNKLYNDEKQKYFTNNKLDINNKKHMKKFNGFKNDILKKVNNFIINSINIDFNDNKYHINSSFIDNPTVVISDFGSIYRFNEACDDEIQTRYYRSPEIILGYEFSYKVDIWSIGCIIYELLTGDILFNPEKDKLRSRDIHHLYWIQQITGVLPREFIINAPNRKKLFDKKLKLRNVKSIDAISLKKIFVDYFNIDDNEANNIESFILNFLQVDPNKRSEINDYLKSPWLN